MLMGSSHAWKGLLLRVGTVALTPALRRIQDPGTFWELRSLSHPLIPGNSPSALHVPFLESHSPQEAQGPQSAAAIQSAASAPCLPGSPEKSHESASGVDFTFPLVFSKWRELSCHSFTAKIHPVLHSEIKLDGDRRAHSEFPVLL